jgi:hypothetical protein
MLALKFKKTNNPGPQIIAVDAAAKLAAVVWEEKYKTVSTSDQTSGIRRRTRGSSSSSHVGNGSSSFTTRSFS